MNDSILNRRSIRKYKDNPVKKEDINKILQAGLLAPSSKNRQPWKFVVVRGKAKSGMLDAIKSGLNRERTEKALLPDSRPNLEGAENTLKIMAQAPVTILILNTLGKDLLQPLSVEERVSEICNIQSIGAAIENMALEAANLGIGSLWICDIFFAYEELKKWLDASQNIVAALSLGYADENPPPRPRKNLSHTVEWLE